MVRSLVCAADHRGFAIEVASAGRADSDHVLVPKERHHRRADFDISSSEPFRLVSPISKSPDDFVHGDFSYTVLRAFAGGDLQGALGLGIGRRRLAIRL